MIVSRVVCRSRMLSRTGLKYFLSVASKGNSDVFKTPLYDFHIFHGGKMVPYAGWSLPSAYDNLSVVQSVIHTRKALSMFDVSHMLQLEICGKDAEQFLETVLVSDLQKLKKGKGTLSLITNDHGGIIDDCIVTRTDDNCFYLVANAACAEKDKSYLKKKLKKFKEVSSNVAVTVSELCDMSLIALQGPFLPSLMNGNVKGDMDKLWFMNSAVMSAFGVEGCRITRCGYTGEDGIEISVSSSRVNELCEKILKNSVVRLAGLGCRDILRTEAGLCLYGNDISEEISPVESGLVWCIGKRRRKEGDFGGSEVIMNQLTNHVQRKRIGLISYGPLPRQHCKVADDSGCVIGHITSGSPSPTLNCNISMAYVPEHISKIGKKVSVLVRNKVIAAVVSKMPFVPTKYYVSKT